MGSTQTGRAPDNPIHDPSEISSSQRDVSASTFDLNTDATIIQRHDSIDSVVKRSSAHLNFGMQALKAVHHLKLKQVARSPSHYRVPTCSRIDRVQYLEGLSGLFRRFIPDVLDYTVAPARHEEFVVLIARTSKWSSIDGHDQQHDTNKQESNGACLVGSDENSHTACAR